MTKMIIIFPLDIHGHPVLLLLPSLGLAQATSTSERVHTESNPCPATRRTFALRYTPQSPRSHTKGPLRHTVIVSMPGSIAGLSVRGASWQGTTSRLDGTTCILVGNSESV